MTREKAETWIGPFHDAIHGLYGSTYATEELARHLRVVGMSELAAQLVGIAQGIREDTEAVKKAVYGNQDRQTRAITGQIGDVLTMVLEKVAAHNATQVEVKE